MNQIHRSPKLNEEYEEIVHPSGIRAYIYKKDFVTTNCMLAVKFGSASERFTDRNGKTILIPDGTAHFLEHKMFEGKDGIDIMDEFYRMGADSNAYTSAYKTVYYFSSADDPYPPLELLLSFVTETHFTEESVEREKGIIKEEIQMYLDDPYSILHKNMIESMYSVLGIRKDPAGSWKTVSGINTDILKKCHEAYYKPENMVLAICGRVETSEVKAILDRVFPVKHSFRNVECIPDEPCFVAKKKRVVKMNVSKPLFSIGFKNTSIESDPYKRSVVQCCGDVVSSILFSDASPLRNRLYNEGLITNNFAFGFYHNSNYSYMYVSGESDAPETVYGLIIEYIDNLRKNGITEQEFVRAKRTLYADIIGMYDSSSEIVSSLLNFSMENSEMFDEIEIVAGMKCCDLMYILDELLDSDRSTLTIVSL